MATTKNWRHRIKLRLPLLKVSLKMVKPSSHIAESLSLLEKQEQEYQSLTDSAQLKNHILCLKLGLPFLGMFLKVSTNKDLKSRIKRALYDVKMELGSLSNKPVDGSVTRDLDRVYTNLLEKMKNVIIKPNTQEYDVIFLEQNTYRAGFPLEQINDFLLWISGDLSSCKADLVTTLVPKIEGIKELLILLQPLHSYLEGSSASFPAESEQLLALVALLDKAACLLYICLVDKMNEEMELAMNRKLSDLLEMNNVEQIYLGILRASRPRRSKCESSQVHLLHNMIQLLDCNARSLQYLNDPSKKLHDKLKFLYTSICGLPHALSLANFNYLVLSIEALTRKSIPILYSCHVRDMKEGMASGVNSALSKVLYQLERIQEDGCKSITLYKYPKIGGLSFLGHFLGNLEEWFTTCPELRETEWGILHAEFNFLRSVLRKIEEQHNEDEELRNLRTRIVGLAYEAEYIVDLCRLREIPVDGEILALSLDRIIKQATLIKAGEKRWIHDEKDHNHPQAQDIANTPCWIPSQGIDNETDEVVGFEENATTIKYDLLGDQPPLDFISIAGMPGIGKTTLAKKIYDDPLIVNHFDVRAWVTVSQTYQKTKLLKTILADLPMVANNIKESNDEYELCECLCRTLRGRRYLIVFDDIWDMKAWNEVQRCFPDDNNHSRILITTRDQNVASNIKQRSKVHILHRLTNAKSWELFLKTLKPEENLSNDFLAAGDQIAQSCEGLPLAIVVIAKLLAKVEKSVNAWNKIARSLSSHILHSPESPCMAILELSYNHLPDDLKPCFLYFGAFPEDAVIPVRKLKQLWIAEGIVCNSEIKKLEDVAEDYFKELINRSLVIATTERSLEGTKACYLHDLLYEFCLKKAKEESFLQWIKQGLEYHRFWQVYNNRHIISKQAPLSSFIVRSMLRSSTWFETRYLIVEDECLSVVCKNFKLLTVLELRVQNLDAEDLSEIGFLIHLRYLAIKLDGYYYEASFPQIPATISNLLNLQYLFWSIINIRRYSPIGWINGQDILWELHKLRHVYMYPSAIFNLDHIEETSEVGNLEKLSIVWFHSQDAVASLSRLPKLQKLSCIFDSCFWDESTKFRQYPKLDFLGGLVSLKVIFKDDVCWGHRFELKFPSNLQKLTLSNCPIVWEDISRMAKTLPNLKVLKIDDVDQPWISERKIHDATWNVSDEDFPQLKYLKLSGLTNFNEWIASANSFPVLERLVLESCRNLKEIPSCFGASNTLQIITVRNCRDSVKESAKNIQMEQEEMGNAELKLYLA